ncbi:MAG: hypothetical protein EPO21_06030 [Chloroflexota bacterium]|nr:MAG: hypothetical protein EPO21_06030 [Chloroflexota bacterium]
MIVRVVKMSMVAIALTLLLAGTASAEPEPQFKFGFKFLADQIPDVVGMPLENEFFDPIDGISHQETSTGMLIWRKADNWLAFTDGVRTWIHSASGIQVQNGDGTLVEQTLEPPSAVPVTQAVQAAPATSPPPRTTASAGSVLDNNLIVSWYGNPNTGAMGVLGQFEGADLAARLQRQANAYAGLTDKNILPAYELIAVVAQASPGVDGLWRRRETTEIMDSMLQQARDNGFVLILDVQVGHSTVPDELEALRPYLEQPDVYLALDPEFDMWPGQIPGEYFGHTLASEVNYAIGFLENVIQSKNLPPKVLIVHQFTYNMLPDKENIVSSPLVDVALDMDGFGAQSLKLATWNMVMQKPLQFAGVKLFYDQDPGLFTPQDVMGLTPVPSVVIYQ